MTKLDITTQTRNLDNFLETLDNPRHRRIIANYRRHAIFEITGHKERIFTPEMTVDHPVYYLNANGLSLTLDGRDQVLAFYSSLEEREATVMVVEDEKLAVADWGFASEAWFNSYMPGRLVPDGWDADPDKLYILRQYLAMNWPYDEQGRMVGEHVYEHADLAELTEIAADEFITLAEAREKLLPLQQELPALDGSPATAVAAR
ncbi:hypothetical protein [[Mycobacterium] burgundiense]|uniref:Uncharacterized protein n=1 Tax=[Mycobacterium] burgundiense TaxID=3064286 RepID=A0ABN9NJR8_9MYCO|nr:hypothetical protein [Mycolicibacterium sp. MU0053]CAJ1507563.1 hypothetical protein MU0053_003554 [Mycolicibacterium sp. MU0053]